MNLRAAFLVGLLALPSAGMLSGADPQPFSVSIHPQREGVVQGHDVILEITLKNISGKIMTVKIFPSQYAYTLDVTRPDGRPAAITENGRNIMKNGAEEMKPSPYVDMRGYLSVTLLPGQVFDKDTIRVDDMYDVWTPGVYSVKVRRVIPDHLGKGAVESNTVNITVTPDPALGRR
jgi:hypothetical protein